MHDILLGDVLGTSVFTVKWYLVYAYGSSTYPVTYLLKYLFAYLFTYLFARRTPLHCAASCNNLAMVRFLVEHGACIFATTLSDQETAAEKCEEDEEGFDGCSEFLYSEYTQRGPKIKRHFFQKKLKNFLPFYYITTAAILKAN